MPPFVGTQIHFTDGTAPLSISTEEGEVDVKGGWVVVAYVTGQTVSYPARIVHDVDTRS
jgi:hypothetical protein